MVVYIGVKRIAEFLTNYENTPTEEEFARSKMNKLLIFSIGVEAIIPLDLVIISNLDKMFCHHPSGCEE